MRRNVPSALAVLLVALLARPAGAEEILFQGVTALRIVREKPRPLRAWIVRVDLTHAGVAVEVSPGGEKDDGVVRARTVRTVLRDEGYALCVNGGVFAPAQAFGGAPVTVEGPAVHAGRLYAPARMRRFALCIENDGRAAIRESPLGEVREAVAGFDVPPCLVDGEISGPDDRPHPRTAAGVSRDGRTLILLVADGRQPVSDGLGLHEVATLLREHGAWDGVNLDGGGSSTLAVRGEDGEVRLLNVPVGLRLPGTERAVGNCIGIRARPLDVGSEKSPEGENRVDPMLVVLLGLMLVMGLVILVRRQRQRR